MGSYPLLFLSEPGEGAREQVLGFVVFAERSRVVLARASLVLLGEDVLEDDPDLELLPAPGQLQALFRRDRKSTRLNSSHTVISYAVFCLKKKKSNADDM